MLCQEGSGACQHPNIYFSQNQKGFGCIVAAVIMVYLCYFLNHTAFFNEMI